MIGYHAVPVIADNWLKGIHGDPQQAVLDAMVASATNPRYAGLDEYMKLGWVAADKEREGASKTLEYAFDDWTISRAAAAMGRADVASKFEARAKNWRIMAALSGVVALVAASLSVMVGEKAPLRAYVCEPLTTICPRPVTARPG